MKSPRGRGLAAIRKRVPASHLFVENVCIIAEFALNTGLSNPMLFLRRTSWLWPPNNTRRSVTNYLGRKPRSQEYLKQNKENDHDERLGSLPVARFQPNHFAYFSKKRLDFKLAMKRLTKACTNAFAFLGREHRLASKLRNWEKGGDWTQNDGAHCQKRSGYVKLNALLGEVLVSPPNGCTHFH